MALLMCDVDMAEQAEIWRLEQGSPRSPALRKEVWPVSPRSMCVENVPMAEEAETASSQMPQAMAVLADAREAVMQNTT